MTLITPTKTATIEPTIHLVGPEQALAWLEESNTSNRSVRTRWVTALAKEIAEGRWKLTFDPIKFDGDGVLIDGQHRLYAIVQSGKTVPVSVVRGVDPGIRDVIDTGLPRSTGDTLGFAGYKNATNLGAVARIAMARDDGLMTTSRDTRSAKYTNSAILEWVQANPSVVDVVQECVNDARQLHLRSAAGWSYAMWVLDQLNHDARVEFRDSIRNAQTNGVGDPRLTLIRYWANKVDAARATRYSVPETLFVTFRCWNAWRADEYYSKVQLVNGQTGPQGAVIPTPVA